MNITFRPFNAEKDKDLVSLFLADAKQAGGNISADPQKDCEAYIAALISTQERDPGFCALMLDGAAVIGFLDVYPLKKMPEIAFLRFDYLIETCRGKGFGGPLMERAIKLMKEQGCKKLLLNVTKTNKRAIAFYGKHKFVVTDKENEIHFQMCRDLRARQ